MAFPVVEATNTSSSSSTSSHSVSLPSGIQAGDLLILMFAQSSRSAYEASTPSGWTQRVNVTATGIRLKIWILEATGSEGSTVTVSTPFSTSAEHSTYRISGWLASNFETATGISSTPDPPDLTLLIGPEEILWLAVAANSSLDHSAAPTNYTNLIQTNSQKSLGSARRNREAASENPGTFTISSSDTWVAVTIGIRPAEDPSGTLYFLTPSQVVGGVDKNYLLTGKLLTNQVRPMDVRRALTSVILTGVVGLIGIARSLKVLFSNLMDNISGTVARTVTGSIIKTAAVRLVARFSHTKDLLLSLAQFIGNSANAGISAFKVYGEGIAASHTLQTIKSFSKSIAEGVSAAVSKSFLIGKGLAQVASLLPSRFASTTAMLSNKVSTAASFAAQSVFSAVLGDNAGLVAAKTKAISKYLAASVGLVAEKLRDVTREFKERIGLFAASTNQSIASFVKALGLSSAATKGVSVVLSQVVGLVATKVTSAFRAMSEAAGLAGRVVIGLSAYLVAAISTVAFAAKLVGLALGSGSGLSDAISRAGSKTMSAIVGMIDAITNQAGATLELIQRIGTAVFRSSAVSKVLLAGLSGAVKNTRGTAVLLFQHVSLVASKAAQVTGDLLLVQSVAAASSLSKATATAFTQSLSTIASFAKQFALLLSNAIGVVVQFYKSLSVLFTETVSTLIAAHRFLSRSFAQFYGLRSDSVTSRWQYLAEVVALVSMFMVVIGLFIKAAIMLPLKAVWAIAKYFSNTLGAVLGFLGSKSGSLILSLAAAMSQADSFIKTFGKALGARLSAAISEFSISGLGGRTYLSLRLFATKIKNSIMQTTIADRTKKTIIKIKSRGTRLWK